MDTKNKIKVIIPFYNPGDFLDMCVSSVLTQDYDNYEVLFIDDCSTDGSFQKIPGCIFKTDENNQPIRDENGEMIILEKHPLLEKTKCQNVVAWKASSRATALPNIHNGIVNFCTDPDDIILIVYGDDWVVGKSTLSKINETYNKTDCLLTYGSCKLSDGKRGYSSEYKEFEFKNIRQFTPKFSLPLSFKKSLYNKFIELDPQTTSFMDKDGNWLINCSNFALTFPLLELAGKEKVQQIKEIIYVYNIDNPLNSERLNSELYYQTQKTIQEKKPLISSYENINPSE